MPSYAGDRPINTGIFTEVVERLVGLGGAVHPSTTRMDTGYTGFVVWPHAHVTPFDVEMLKWVILDLIDAEPNLEVLLHASVVSAFQEGGSARGIVTESKSGRIAFTADVIVDATGDGDVANMLEAPYEKGSEGTGLMQPATIFFASPASTARPSTGTSPRIRKSGTSSRSPGRRRRPASSFHRSTTSCFFTRRARTKWPSTRRASITSTARMCSTRRGPSSRPAGRCARW